MNSLEMDRALWNCRYNTSKRYLSSRLTVTAEKLREFHQLRPLSILLRCNKHLVYQKLIFKLLKHWHFFYKSSRPELSRVLSALQVMPNLQLGLVINFDKTGFFVKFYKKIFLLLALKTRSFVIWCGRSVFSEIPGIWIQSGYSLFIRQALNLLNILPVPYMTFVFLM